MSEMYASLLSLMDKHYPNYAGVWRESRELFGDSWEQQFNHHMSLVFGAEENDRWMEAIHGYAEFCTEALRAQVFFERHGHYKASCYEDVVEECYRNPEYMNERYLPGQYLSHYIWSHHQKMLQHFIQDLLPKVADSTSLFYEVGVGCGMYSQKTLEHLSDARGVGYDISEYALSFTARVVADHSFESRYETKLENIIESPIQEKADFVISQEVLEHLEDPQTFINGLYESVRPGGWGYITAAINAAHTDHIYLYRSPEEVQQQIEAAGWEVCDCQIEFSYEEKPIEFRPTVAGYLTRRPD